MTKWRWTLLYQWTSLRGVDTMESELLLQLQLVLVQYSKIDVLQLERHSTLRRLMPSTHPTVKSRQSELMKQSLKVKINYLCPKHLFGFCVSDAFDRTLTESCIAVFEESCKRNAQGKAEIHYQNCASILNHGPEYPAKRCTGISRALRIFSNQVESFCSFDSTLAEIPVE